ncbi:MAG: hypothetical protein IKL60_00985 [Alistipes sp.]|nr:hypothetical protein [Alistipes sp.]
MRRFLIILLAVVGGVATSVAQMRTAYFMEGSYFRTEMNAALAPTRGYLQVIPGVGGLGVNVSNNYFSVNNLFYQRDGQVHTFMSSKVTADEFLKQLGNKGRINANLTTTLLGFGAHTDKLFWSFGLNLRSTSEVTLSKDMFTALKGLTNGYYDLGDTSLSNREYLEAAVGFAIPLKDFMTFGFRVKGLVGIADISMGVDEMYLDVNEEYVRASMMGNIRANSPIFNPNYLPGSDLAFDTIIHNDYRQMLKNVKSWGLGLDFGFEFRFLEDQLKVSVGVNDLGFIRWNRASTINAMGNAGFMYEGFNLSTNEAKVDHNFAATMTAPTGAYTTRLNCSLNAGIEYNILQNHIAFGLLSHTQFCQSHTRTELTASVNFRIGRWLSTSFSHTFLNGNEPGVFGWAVNVHPTGFNLFLGADFIDTRFAVYNGMAIPKMLSSANVYVGVGFNLGKAKYMRSMQPIEKKSKKSKSQPTTATPESTSPAAVAATATM